MSVPVTIIPTRSPSALIAETVVEALVVAFVRVTTVMAFVLLNVGFTGSPFSSVI